MTPWRIHDRATFESLRRSRCRAQRDGIKVAYVAGDAATPPRVAYAVARRTGNAVARNRMRRRLRIVVSGLSLPGGAYLVSAEPAVLTATSTDLRRHLGDAVAEATALAHRGHA